MYLYNSFVFSIFVSHKVNIVDVGACIWLANVHKKAEDSEENFLGIEMKNPEIVDGLENILVLYLTIADSGTDAMRSLFVLPLEPLKR